jgi:hypothetical protein
MKCRVDLSDLKKIWYEEEVNMLDEEQESGDRKCVCFSCCAQADDVFE